MSAELNYELFEEELLAPLRGHKLSDEEMLVASLLLDAKSSRPVGIKHIVEVMNSRRGQRCADCDAAARLAYSDATTPGFYHSKCERHQDARALRKVNDRVVKDIIRTLRKDHEFPILSRKFARPKEVDPAGNVIAEAKPAGYWYGESEDEMREYYEHASKQPLDEWHTLHRMMRVNFPRLAGQLQLQDIPPVPEFCGNRDGEPAQESSS